MKKVLLFLSLFVGGASVLQAQTAPTTMYFANNSDDIVRSANIDGSNVAVAVPASTNITFIEGIAVDPINNHIYVNDGGSGSAILRYDLDGTNETIIVPGLISPDDIALDLVNNKIWWGESGFRCHKKSQP